jgi:hypothetical protein
LPAMAKVLGGSGLGNLSGNAKLFPVHASDPKIRRLVEFLDIADEPLDEMLTQWVQNRQVSDAAAGIFKATIAGTEIILEYANPSDKSDLEKTLSISLNALNILEPMTSFVSPLAHSKPYLVALIDMGGQLLAAVQMNSDDVRMHPKSRND